ncbi:MAG: hypothetical protein LQ352_003992 [Teloschistes flavicans]|nr:MAG: hypothetical protein LQ352_003992 [Teloschistes flavicans]
MTGKRKRHRPQKPDVTPCKRVRYDVAAITYDEVTHPTLSLYYPRISTLRHHILSKLPASSKKRRRRILAVKRNTATKVCTSKVQSSQGSEFTVDDALGTLLDRTLVCSRDDEYKLDAQDQDREQDFRLFSPRHDGPDESSLLEPGRSLPEIIDFAIWLLFHRVHRHSHKPMHLLCHGYQRMKGPVLDEQRTTLVDISGLVLHYPNSHVGALKTRPWTDLLNLLGKDGEQIVLDLLLNAAVYTSVESGRGNYYQLSGTPMTELQPWALSKPLCNLAVHDRSTKSSITSICKLPSQITIVRNRIFYARPALNAKGRIRFGLHVLNRYPDYSNPVHTVHIMKYIFPRQFGLHNAFTSKVDSKETAQPFKDYTLREREISQGKACSQQTTSATSGLSLPKRLRGSAFNLVLRLQKLHSQCAYYELLKHYCPARRTTLLPDCGHAHEPVAQSADISQSTPVVCTAATQTTLQSQSTFSQALASTQMPPMPVKPSQLNIPLVECATPFSEVSAFCQAAISTVIPNEFWGQAADGCRNKKVIMGKINQFIRLRRFESLTLHAISQDLKISSMAWLAPLHFREANHISSSDLGKRKEILYEFLYYLFDSFLIPLIRSNFHVTESSLHKNRIFYFRHDVWKALTEPEMSRIKKSMFEEIPMMKARRLLDTRPLGFSQIRLLPKGTGVRPIMNLRRRVTKLQNGKAVLGRSINSIMAPVHTMLDLERRQDPASVGSALFSVGDLYPKLKTFRDGFRCKTKQLPHFYFAKVDVQSCFDTIPQRGAIEVVEQLASEDKYWIARHAEIKAADMIDHNGAAHQKAKPARKFPASAHPHSDFRSCDEMIEEQLAAEKKNTVFVDNVVRTTHKRQQLLHLLREHVEGNVVKLGKKFYRQKKGIPQGSVLSSLLCNCFYAKLEATKLSFVEKDGSLLLRLIDDFLFITTERQDALRFLQIMHDGIAEFGVQVNPAKSLTNFRTEVNGLALPSLSGNASFPYCGTLIDTRTLEIGKDRDRRKATALADSLTVEQSSSTGQAFHRKALKYVLLSNAIRYKLSTSSAYKLQTHKMFLDSNFNSLQKVLSNVYQNFLEASMKYYRYVKSMPRDKHPHNALLTGEIA